MKFWINTAWIQLVLSILTVFLLVSCMKAADEEPLDVGVQTGSDVAGVPVTDNGGKGAADIAVAPDLSQLTDSAVSDVSPKRSEDTGPLPECTAANAATKCNDFDNCTTDSCVDGKCVTKPKMGCCKTDSDCDDGVACTEDSCNAVKGECLYTFEDNNCCKTTADCNDGDPCTEEVCVANKCLRPKASDCECVLDILCDDGNPCTKDKCLSKTCVYSYAKNENCCESAEDCNDNKSGTSDVCQQHVCWNKAQSCQIDEQCIPTNGCLSGQCVQGQCEFKKNDSCCSSQSDCDDGHAVTQDACVSGVCVNSLGSVKACNVDTECQSGSSCVVGSCAVAVGQCTYKPNSINDGSSVCCLSTSDCPASTGCDTWQCQNFQCAQTPTGGKLQVWGSDFDTGAMMGWAVAGDGKKAIWQISSNQAISKPNSLYYGILANKNYHVGGATKGSVTSPLITPPAGPLFLSFQRNAAIEPGTANDKLWLELVQGSAVTIIWDKTYKKGPGAGWKLVELDITNQVKGPFKLRFQFDSVDGKDNFKEGVYVDNVSVSTSCP